MSDPLEPDPAAETHTDGSIDDEGQLLDVLPVLSGPPRIVSGRAFRGGSGIERRAVAMLPAAQAAAVAAGGFLAGAAMLGIVHRRQRQSSALSSGRRAGRELARRGSRGPGRTDELLQIVSSRSVLLDVHLLGRPGAGAER